MPAFDWKQATRECQRWLLLVLLAVFPCFLRCESRIDSRLVGIIEILYILQGGRGSRRGGKDDETQCWSFKPVLAV